MNVNKLIVEEDSVKIGGMLAKAEPCLVVYNADHKNDYYSYVITQPKQGEIAFISLYFGGNSKNYSKEVNTARAGFLVKAVFGANQKKHEQERMYYKVMNDLLVDAWNNI